MRSKWPDTNETSNNPPNSPDSNSHIKKSGNQCYSIGLYTQHPSQSLRIFGVHNLPVANTSGVIRAFIQFDEHIFQVGWIKPPTSSFGGATSYPTASMYGIFTYIYHRHQPRFSSGLVQTKLEMGTRPSCQQTNIEDQRLWKQTQPPGVGLRMGTFFGAIFF